MHGEWGYLRPDGSVDKLYSHLKKVVSLVNPPIYIIALEDEKPIGVIALKPTEMSQFPERKYWLGSLFVDSDYRGQGVATLLESEVIKVAKSLSISELYLQTEALDGGLYVRLGWEKLEQISYQGITVQVMRKALKNFI